MRILCPPFMQLPPGDSALAWISEFLPSSPSSPLSPLAPSIPSAPGSPSSPFVPSSPSSPSAPSLMTPLVPSVHVTVTTPSPCTAVHESPFGPCAPSSPPHPASITTSEASAGPRTKPRPTRFPSLMLRLPCSRPSHPPETLGSTDHLTHCRLRGP